MQTSKTLLIEQFTFTNESDESERNLATLLRTNEITDKNIYSDILKTLEVRSFEEFVKKFTPTVYQWVTPTETDRPAFNFSLEKPDPKVAPKPKKTSLDENEFYKMVMSVYSAKGASGKSNYDFDYTKVAELLSPQKVLDDAKRLRDDFDSVCKKYYALDESRKAEKSECAKKIMDIREKIVRQYKDNFLANLKLAIADTETKWLTCSSNPPSNNPDSSNGGNSKKQLTHGKIRFLDNGDLRVEKVEIEDLHSDQPQIEYRDPKKKALGWIENDFDRNATESEGAYVKEIVCSNYGHLSDSTIPLDPNQLKANLKKYREWYLDAQTRFVMAISSAVERMLNVKVFFDQATINGGKLRAPLIVANCKADQLLDDGVRGKFRTFITELGNDKNEKNKIWFAILPAIGDKAFLDNVVENKNYIDILEGSDKGMRFGDGSDETKNPGTIETNAGEKLVDKYCLKQMVELLGSAGVTTFFNYRANETTGFGKLNSDLLDKYRDHLEPLDNNPYAVFCYPNFTVLPKRETCVPIGGLDSRLKKEFGDLNLDVSGIYIDASYVAAGLVVGSQDPDYLESKGYKNVEKDNPCVRVDLEKERLKMLTTMNREGGYDWDGGAGKNIDKDKFGFCFCGNFVDPKGDKKGIQYSYVYCARNMDRDSNGQYKPIYTTLTMNFLMYALKSRYVSISENDVQDFIDGPVADWQRESSKQKGVPVNCVLEKGEEVTKERESDSSIKIKVKFNQAEMEQNVSIEQVDSKQTNNGQKTN